MRGWCLSHRASQARICANTPLSPGAGYDQCNIPDCTKAGIHVSNVPTAVDAATADTALFLMLGALRMFASPLVNLRKGEFRGKIPPPLGHDPEGKIVGIVGMGGIGRDFKKKAEALGMKVQYHNRSKLSDEMSGGAKYVGFEELLGTSDVISLNVPLNVSLLVHWRELSFCLCEYTLDEASHHLTLAYNHSRNQPIT